MAKKKQESECDQIEKAQAEGLHAYAAELARRYVASHPSDPGGFRILGLCLQDLRLYPEAKQALEAALPLFPSSELATPVLAALGQICWFSGDLSKAEYYYKKVVEADPTDADGYILWAGLLRILGRCDEAEKFLNKGIQAQASPIESLHFTLADLLSAKGDLPKAAEAYAQALAVDPEYEDAASGLEDSGSLARLKGIDLPIAPPTTSKAHKPGNMTATSSVSFLPTSPLAENKSSIAAPPTTGKREWKTLGNRHSISG